jgi:hypothetical protein
MVELIFIPNNVHDINKEERKNVSRKTFQFNIFEFSNLRETKISHF